MPANSFIRTDVVRLPNEVHDPMRRIEDKHFAVRDISRRKRNNQFWFNAFLQVSLPSTSVLNSIKSPHRPDLRQL